MANWYSAVCTNISCRFTISIKCMICKLIQILIVSNEWTKEILIIKRNSKGISWSVENKETQNYLSSKGHEYTLYWDRELKIIKNKIYMIFYSFFLFHMTMEFIFEDRNLLLIKWINVKNKIRLEIFNI